MATLDPDAQRRHAFEVVRRLRAEGFEAYWAGGCVRDRLLGRVPKDYDVATDARPEQVRALFGPRRTLAIGAAFGVIAVRGPRAAGSVEVTTFRRDAAYSDGRHPDHVEFSSAEEDASRRDFTINGLFFDPVEERVIDFVGGQADLAARRVRAIGRARDRFAEDKLRMLRAVRFAATFDFALDAEASRAIREMAPQIHALSPERIAMEMRLILGDARRAAGARLLLETGLAAEVLPEIVPHAPSETCASSIAVLERLQHSEEAPHAPSETCASPIAVLERLKPAAGFPLALAAALVPCGDDASAAAVGRRWRLANTETRRTAWLLKHWRAIERAATMPWSALQPLLIAPGAEDLLVLAEAASPEAGAAGAAHCRRLLTQPRERLDPPPLVTGDDLLALGIPAGPRFKAILQRIRAAQLDGEIRSKTEAMELAQRERKD